MFSHVFEQVACQHALATPVVSRGQNPSDLSGLHLCDAEHRSQVVPIQRPVFDIDVDHVCKRTGVAYICSATGLNHVFRARTKICSQIEDVVVETLSYFLSNPELVASFAIDACEFYRSTYTDAHYIDNLEDELKTTDKALSNVQDAVEKTVYIEQLIDRLSELNARKEVIEEKSEVSKQALTACSKVR